LARANRAIEVLAEGLALIGGMVIVILMTMISLDALGRKTFGALPGALEFSEALMAPAVFLPLMFVQMKRENVFVGAATLWLSPRAQSVLDGIAAVVGIGVFGFLTWLALNSALASFAIREYRVAIVDVPIWPFRWMIPIGTGFLVFQLVLTAFEEFARALGRAAPPPENLEWRPPHE
jgi:TRAP-type C4-dicarboxylate transport system permease small subunit